MEKQRRLIACFIFFIAITCLFYYTIEDLKRKQLNQNSIKLPSDHLELEERSDEVLGRPIGKKTSLRPKSRLEVMPKPPVIAKEDAPLDAFQPARPFKPNLTHLADLAVHEAYAGLVKEYLSPWLHPNDPNKIAAPLTQRALSAMEWSYKGGGFRVRIFNNRLLYRKLVYWRQTYRSQRMLWYLRFLYDMLQGGELDGVNVDFILYVGDGPKVAADTFTTDAGFPLLSLRTSLAHVDIPVPDPVSHGSNGQYQWTEAGKQVPWSDRLNRLMFRGRGSCLKMQADNWMVCNRVRAQRLSKERPDILDIGIIEWNQLYQSKLCETLTEAEVENSSGLAKVEPMDFDAQSHYKYILDLDGGLGSSRKPGILSSGSVLFSQDSPWYTFYEPLLSAYTHYVPVDKWLRQLTDKVEWANRHDETLHAIQLNGAAFERKFLSIASSKKYMAILLKEFQKLLKEPIIKDDPVMIDYCNKMRESQGAAEITAGPMGCSTGWFEYTGEGSIPEHVLNDRAAFKNAAREPVVY